MAPVGQAEQVLLGSMTLLAGQLQVPKLELNVIPVAMQLQVVKEAGTAMAYGMEEQFKHWVLKLLPMITIVVGEVQPHVLLAVTQLSFPIHTHDFRSAEGPTIYVEGVQDRHLTFAVAPPKTTPLRVVPQSQRALVELHVRVLETHEQVEIPVLARVFAVALAQMKQETVLPIVIRAEVVPQSQNPLGFQVSLAIQVHEVLVVLVANVLVPEVPQTKQLPLRRMVFVRVVQDLQALICHLSVDRVQMHPPEPSPEVVPVGHLMHEVLDWYAIE